MLTTGRIRILLLSLVVLSAGVLAVGFLTAATSEQPATESKLAREAALDPGDRHSLVGARDNMTVVSNYDGPLVAYAPNGSLYYHDNAHKSYWDVDPSPNGKRTVVYSATDDDVENCPRKTPCTRNVIERANLSTGAVERLYVRYVPGVRDNEWHDIDRINDSHYVVADMASDEVYIVNVSSGIQTWTWDAQSAFDVTSGGSDAFTHSKGWPKDWTHVNDVEVLQDGTIMASLRNHDQIVFINRTTGQLEDRTIGSDDDYSVMYEQHNPDYIPEERGGPAVVNADSQNNRIVEYQRTENGSWRESWVWSDASMAWPRDADRLPGGHTLITDTNSHRVMEVGENGTVVWQATITAGDPYEAERLGTGDESATGRSAAALGLNDRSVTRNTTEGGTLSTAASRAKTTVRNLIPNKILNAVLFVVPNWMGVGEMVAALVLVASASVWGVFEVRRTLGVRIRLSSPVEIRRKDD
jgi:hypothetical protein